jgi:hypothetical protein
MIEKGLGLPLEQRVHTVVINTAPTRRRHMNTPQLTNVHYIVLRHVVLRHAIDYDHGRVGDWFPVYVKGDQAKDCIITALSLNGLIASTDGCHWVVTVAAWELLGREIPAP